MAALGWAFDVRAGQVETGLDVSISGDPLSGSIQGAGEIVKGVGQIGDVIAGGEAKRLRAARAARDEAQASAREMEARLALAKLSAATPAPVPAAYTGPVMGAASSSGSSAGAWLSAPSWFGQPRWVIGAAVLGVGLLVGAAVTR